jgi:hypothetical protein
MVGYIYKKDIETNRKYNIVSWFIKRTSQIFWNPRSSPSPMQGLETTAIDPTTGDEPLGVDSVMNIKLSRKILPYGGEETLEQKHSRRRVALSAKDSCGASRRCLGTLVAEASRASRAPPDLNALILYSHPRRPYVR